MRQNWLSQVKSSSFEILIDMAFEQLAVLKEELAREAATKRTNQQRQPASKKSGKPLADPLVLVIVKLQKAFPLAFPKKPLPKVPLKIGIHQDLVEQVEQLGIDRSMIRAALKKWCRGIRYSECMIAGADRLDLTGNVVGQVSKEEAAQAEEFRQPRNQDHVKRAEALV